MPVESFNAKTAFPVGTALTGTISNGYRNDDIVGTGTAFTTECQEGDWLYVDAHDTLARIINIVSDTKMTVDRETTALSGESAEVLPNVDYDFISIMPTGGDCDITTPGGLPVTHTTSEPVTFQGRRRPLPVIVDPTSTVKISYSL